MPSPTDAGFYSVGLPDKIGWIMPIPIPGRWGRPMAKKKRKPPKKSSRPGKKPPSPTRDELISPERRMMERASHESLNPASGPTQSLPLMRAQEIAEQAFDSDDPDERIALARKALEI